MHQISRNLQKVDKSLTRLKEQDQYNKLGFRSLIRFQNTKDQC